MAQQKRRPAPGRQQDPEEEEIEETPEDGAELDTRINRVITGRLKRFSAEIRQTLSEQLTPIQEALARRAAPEDEESGEREDEEQEAPAPRRGQRAARPEPQEDQQPTVRRRSPANGRYQRAEDPEVANLKKQIATMQADQKAKEEQLRNRERDGLLTEALTKAGVDPLRLKGAVLLLRDTLAYDDKEQAWSYRARRDGFDEDVDIGAGVKEWAATDEGKSYLAPQQQPRAGAGTRVQQAPAGVVTSGARAPDPKAAKTARMQNAQTQLVQATSELLGGGAPTS